jgi:CHASE3 domain sensor protein
MFAHLAAVPSEEDQRAAYAQELEEKAAKAVAAMQEAVAADDDQTFQTAAAECGSVQETWLVVAQRMTPEQARTVMVAFAHNDMTRWMEERIPGPPPLIFDRYTP